MKNCPLQSCIKSPIIIHLETMKTDLSWKIESISWLWQPKRKKKLTLIKISTLNVFSSSLNNINFVLIGLDLFLLFCTKPICLLLLSSVIWLKLWQAPQEKYLEMCKMICDRLQHDGVLINQLPAAVFRNSLNPFQVQAKY